MSLLKITDPKKRDLLVNEFLKTKQNIQRELMSKRLGESDIQREFAKVFKRITDTRKALKESIVSGIKPISWLRSIVVRTPVLASELSLYCARLMAGRVTTLWVKRSLSVNQHGQLSQPSLRGRLNE